MMWKQEKESQQVYVNTLFTLVDTLYSSLIVKL